MKTAFAFLSCALALSLGLASAPTRAAAPVVIKFSHVVAPDTPKGRAAEHFRKLVESRSKGAVVIEIYPNSQLYKDKEELEALQLGSVQMLAPSLAKFGPLGAREFEAFDLPYLFDSYDALHKVTQGPVGQAMLKRLEEKGITGLGFWDNGFKSFSANKKLSRPSDLRGMKMRIQSSKVLEAQMRALRALPQIMSFSEVYQALQTGVVDGTENPPSNFYTQKMHEVQKFLTISNHGYLGYAVIVNRAFWQGLRPETRKLLEDCMAESTRFANEIAKVENDQALEKVRQSGRTEVVILSAAEITEWRKALLPVHQEMQQKIGNELLNSIYQATGFKASGP